MQPFLVIVGLIIVYGILHSIMAAMGFKRRMRQWLGERTYEGWYRLIFNIIAFITFLPVLWYGATQPGDVLWSINPPWSYGLRLIQLVGIIGLSISFLEIDGLRFLGLRQVMTWLNGDPLPLPEEPLQLGGVYRLVRHPLYLFTLMVLWASPRMDTAGLGLVVGVTLYFVIGSILEEQKLRAAFGQEYMDYQQRVPWMIPFAKF